MRKIPSQYLEKVYAGFLGKAIGVRLGAPVEPAVWTHEKILEVYGDIKGYVKDYTNFAADDDTNGPIFFIRALEDYGKERDITAEDVGNTWLNYTCEGHGMFWWGGYGISTEHTAYLNLKNGIKAPMSGSIERNGLTCAEQIGGQIFIDSWGLVCPGNPTLAAEFARKAASVSHDGNGIYGGMFIAACISEAFFETDMRKIIDVGLSVIPSECEYMRMAKDVIAFYEENPDDYKDGFQFVKDHYGYDKYEGICHIIPNSAIILLALLYGEGDYSKSIIIATMCGWDTDCNAGNVGTILGVKCGIEAIDDHWRKPINDTIIASSIMGSLNIVDIPTFCKDIARLGYRVAKEDIPTELSQSLYYRDIYYDFNIPGSTHGFRLSNDRKSTLRNVNDLAYAGERCLKVIIKDLRKSEFLNIYNKPFYRVSDFDDNRYRPAFSPTVYPGQTLSVKYYMKKDGGEDAYISLYVRNTNTKEYICSKPVNIGLNEWAQLSFTIPDMDGDAIDEMGIRVENLHRETYIGRLYLDEFQVTGKANYSIDFSKESHEFAGVTQFTFNGGHVELENGYMVGKTFDQSEVYTGHYYMKDFEIITHLIPRAGLSHLFNFRVKGAMMSYAVGFSGQNRVVLLKNNHGYHVLEEKAFDWEYNKEYAFKVIAKGNHFQLYINDEEVFNYVDLNEPFSHGAFGFSQLENGRTSYGKMYIKEQ